MGKMVVYHGSNVETKEPKIIFGRNTKDFGTGFYCTVIKEQAERWAKRYASPVVNTYQITFCTQQALKCITFIKSEAVK